MKLRNTIKLVSSLTVALLALPAQALLIDFTETEWSEAHATKSFTRSYVVNDETYHIQLDSGPLTRIASTQDYDGGANDDYCMNTGPLACEIDGIGITHFLDTSPSEIDTLEFLTVSFWNSSYERVTASIDAIYLLDLYDEKHDDIAYVGLWNDDELTVLPPVSGSGNSENGGFFTIDEANSGLPMFADSITFTSTGKFKHKRDFALAGLLVGGEDLGTVSIDIPEPETMSMFGVALLIAGGLRRRKQ